MYYVLNEFRFNAILGHPERSEGLHFYNSCGCHEIVSRNSATRERNESGIIIFLIIIIMFNIYWVSVDSRANRCCQSCDALRDTAIG